MNGRVYDPLTAMFFSPDPQLQAPGDWLNYNRYGYCMNNPFRYTDPSGYVSEFSRFFRDNSNTIITTAAAIAVFAGVFIATGGTGTAVAAKVAAGIYAATASGATTGSLGTALNGGSFGDCFLAGTKGGIFGGMSGMAAAGIGGIFGNVGTLSSGKFNVLNELGRAGSHSLTQGGIAMLSGGDFWQGAASGALGSLGGSAAQGLGIHGWGMVGVSAALGGVGAYIGGARSTEEILYGVAVGAIVGTLNHYTHKIRDSDPEDVQLTNKIRKVVGNSKAVQIVEKNVINEDGVVNIVLQILDNAGNKLAEISLKTIDLVKFMIDYIAPVTNKSLEDEYLFNKINPVPFHYEPGQNSNGYMDKYGNWHSTK